MSAPGRLDEETVTTLLGEEAARVLSTARDASTQIRERAEESATRLVKDAAEDAARIRESANIEASRIREDAAHDAEAEIEMAKQQGRDMVNEARAYREKVLSELSRRRDAARGQIEQLLHGRDRLLNAFERARLASEDVINGLTEAHDEPEFIVDLSPTTGPVPVINPEHPSVKPFDHEVANTEIAVVEVAVEDTVIFDDETAVITEEVIAVEPTVIEEVVEAIVDIDPAVSEVEETAAPVESMTHPVHDAVADTTEQTNVVSLFGRGRRHEDVPEVPVVEEHLEEVVAVEPTVIEEVVDVVVEEEVVKPRTANPGVDDIFAKLRAGSTTDVAAKASDVEPVVTEADTVAPEVVVAHVVAADPVRFAERNEVLAPLVVGMARKLKRVLAERTERRASTSSFEALIVGDGCIPRNC